MNTFIDTKMVQLIIEQNGPTEEQYTELSNWFESMLKFPNQNDSDYEGLAEIKLIFTDLFQDKESMFGHVMHWPHGYPGDYEIIEKIYQYHIVPNPKFEKWDKWFQQTEAVQAVRNRKTYFKEFVAKKAANGKTIKVLNLASGPCRDLLEFFEEYPNADVYFDCIEIDPNAVQYARQLLGIHKNKVTFHLANVFKYDTIEQYDLIWSAGLFDYFDDKIFVKVLQRYQHNLNLDGEIVVGNFYSKNPTRKLMQFFGWVLNYRTYDQLLDLAANAGYSPSKMRVESEPTGVNLFIRIWK